MDDTSHKWIEADFQDIDGVLVMGDDAYFTPEALAKRLGLAVEVVLDRVKRKRIPSVKGLVDGARLVPLSALEAKLKNQQEAENGNHLEELFGDDEVTPALLIVAEDLARQRR